MGSTRRSYLTAVYLTAILTVSLHSIDLCAQKKEPLDEWDNLDMLIEASDIDPSDYAIFIDYLDRHGKDPAEYLIAKCKTHQLVILGEWHHLVEYERFMRDLIPDLYYKAAYKRIEVKR